MPTLLSNIINEKRIDLRVSRHCVSGTFFSFFFIHFFILSIHCKCSPQMNNLELVSKLAKPSCWPRYAFELRRSIRTKMLANLHLGSPVGFLLSTSAEKLFNAKTRFESLDRCSLSWTVHAVPDSSVAPLLEHKNKDCPVLHMSYRLFEVLKNSTKTLTWRTQ